MSIEEWIERQDAIRKEESERIDRSLKSIDRTSRLILIAWFIGVVGEIVFIIALVS